ncbi:hypothetical protein BON68_01105 [Escherichia coli]|nr:hypothetical protein BON68_01105 [Escherichia coli]
MKINYGAFCFLPHNTVTNHLHVMRQKASSAGHIIAHMSAPCQHLHRSPSRPGFPADAEH